MQLGKVIFVDDQLDQRNTYTRRLNRYMKDIVETIAIAPDASLSDMITKLYSIKDVVSFIIDENLRYSGVATYQGVELIKKIREADPKIPIYIMTSDASSVDRLLGDIEFVIDKVDFNNSSERDKIITKFIRHINTYKDIRCQQAERFDYLLSKSIREPLSEVEQQEYDALNLVRARALIDEGSVSDKDLIILDRKMAELAVLEEELQAIIVSLNHEG